VMNEIELTDPHAGPTRLPTSWERIGFQLCFIGGLAVQHGGEPPQTNNFDATIWTEFGIKH